MTQQEEAIVVIKLRDAEAKIQKLFYLVGILQAQIEQLQKINHIHQ